MSSFSDRLNETLTRAGYTVYRLSKEAGLNETVAYNVVRGHRRPTDDVLEKIATVSALMLTVPVLRSWRLLDEYSPEEILAALDALLPTAEDKAAALTQRIPDAASRAALVNRLDAAITSPSAEGP